MKLPFPLLRKVLSSPEQTLAGLTGLARQQSLPTTTSDDLTLPRQRVNDTSTTRTLLPYPTERAIIVNSRPWASRSSSQLLLEFSEWTLML